MTFRHRNRTAAGASAVAKTRHQRPTRKRRWTWLTRLCCATKSGIVGCNYGYSATPFSGLFLPPCYSRLFCFFSSLTTPVSSNNHMLFTLFIVACARPIHSTSDCTPSSTGEIALSQTPRSPLVYYYYYYYRYYYYYHSHYDRIYRKNSPSCVVITLITTSATTGPRNTTRDLYHSGRFFFSHSTVLPKKKRKWNLMLLSSQGDKEPVTTYKISTGSVVIADRRLFPPFSNLFKNILFKNRSELLAISWKTSKTTRSMIAIHPQFLISSHQSGRFMKLLSYLQKFSIDFFIIP